MTRRAFLQVAGGLVLATVTEIRLPHPSARAITRVSWVERGVFPGSGTYTSPPFTTPNPFNSIEVSWKASVPPGGNLALAVRASPDGQRWSDWIFLRPDPHVDPLPSDGRLHAAPVLLEPSTIVQYRVQLEPGLDGSPVQLEEVELGCVDTRSQDLRFLAETPLIDGWIIPRAGWGADESLRFASNGREIWPPSYAPVEKVVIHHTVTQNNPPDPAASVRAIYAYHAITQGWGDIGYNFLVDWQGNVYEGRFGGPNVVGAHTAGYNTGTLGIAVLGDFESTAPPQAAIDSLIRLIRERAPQIDPGGISYFRDLVDVPNIGAHRDYNLTECPGDHLYEVIPDIRGRLKGTGPIVFRSKPRPGLAQGELVSVTFTPAELYAGTAVRVDITVRNTGEVDLLTQGPPPGFTYDENQSFESAGYSKIEGRFRVGIDFEGNTGIPNPFRWGLPDRLPPGQETTVTGFIRLHSIRHWRFSASLVQEFVRYQQQGVFPQDVVTLPAPTSPVPASSDPNMVYFPETQHNVPRIFYDYWQANGGLERFGYPLTEPFPEVSLTDGNTYLTQYFERARFEHHPELAGTQFEVLLGLLGSERTAGRRQEPPFQPVPPPSEPDVDYFPETGHTLRGLFRQYWWQNGGLPIFGYPISEEFEEQSKTDGQVYVVQYFERNRFEWHPEFAGTRYEVLLGHLAREILIDRGWL
ncbi:N-acetylmuramoyl-L-alanine amidase [Thermomicrobiaceae bacterium CFH 74404]|uniref:N-acetylmuramoyl-L-alanine amidase n=1 Tax=Thermalbibacter longus TaxID=2951981 RepID=A0AA41WAE1_9BACT|nr:N-acetylmuramoyl-L-alanine amidase [Thermalbibacter longus]MCM8747592.1 N-acetylmuramoyl-L-alanine amidase [Thermalbibacter longus]